MRPAATRRAIEFVMYGCQYYANARFAANAECALVVGNLFHHAVEMILKGGLAPKRDTSDLKDMGHRLKVVWRAFKAEFPDPELQRHNTTISRLDKFEEIRYPGETMKPRVAMVQWSHSPETPVVKMDVGGKPARQYIIVVSDIDMLIADIFKKLTWSASGFIGHHSAVLEVIKRDNDYAELLLSGA
jgi:hypothetical protein